MDTSIFVGYLRAGRYGEFLRREIARGGVFLPGVVLCELQAGATARGDRADVETLRRALGTKIVGTGADDWSWLVGALHDTRNVGGGFGHATTSPTPWSLGPRLG